MGDYTWFKFTAAFREGNQALPTLSWLCDPRAERKDRDQLPEHAFFNDPYVRFMLTKDSAHHVTGQTVLRFDSHFRDEYIMSIDCSFNSRSTAMLPLFLSWLRPFDQGDSGFRGFYLYPYEVHPYLIYRELDQYEFRAVNNQRQAFDADKLKTRVI